MVDAVVGLALEKLNSLILREFSLIYGVRDDLNKLSETLSTIRDVLADAERRQIRENPIANWLTKLKHAAYDADDVLDEWLTEADQGSSSCLNSMNLILFRRKMAKKIKKMLDTFEELGKQKRDFMLNSGPFPEMHSQFDENRETTSLISEHYVYGRDGDKESITHMLLNNEDGRKNVTVFPVVGMGGLGKTTLAQLVYNDERVKKFFEPRTWVCVSEPFDVKRVLKAIVEAVENRPCDLKTLQAIQSKVGEILNDKKYLLVLDDVWNEEREKWNQLERFLEGGAQGSSIILTTRSPKVASITSVVQPYNLEGLSDNDCWLLIKNYAFGDSNEEEHHPNLVPIGQAIVKRCKGLPLVAKTLGGLLGLKIEEDHWNYVKDNEIWNLKEGEENSILLALRLSYDHLPSCLKQCFAYCSVYPKDHRIERGELINLWIANGFIQSQENNNLEEIGNSVFSELLQRAFFQDAEEDHHTNIVTCNMHDLMHDLAISITSDECLEVDVGASKKHVPKTIRHLRVISNSTQSSTLADPLPTPQPSLRTLFFHSINFDSFKFPNTLRVLDLSYMDIERLPPSICQLKLLRYLNLSHSYITSLPKSICKLRNLQMLDLSYNKKLEALPNSIGELEHLRYLNVSGTSITSIPDSFNRLKNLRYFNLLGVRIASLSLDSLSMLKNLQWLDLSHNHRISFLPPSIGILENLKYLNVSYTHITSLPDSILMLPNLQTLNLNMNLSLSTLPPFVGNLKHLRYIGLSATNITLLPHFLHRLPNVLKLDLRFNREITTLPPSIGILVSLRYLDLSDCWSLKALPETVCDLTNLESLLLSNCEELEGLPETLRKLTNMKHLDIKCCRIRKMPIGIGELTCLQTLRGYFVIGDPDKDSGCAGISELQRLNQLRGKLGIGGLENVRNAEEATTANLGSKQYITELELAWSSSGEDGDDDLDGNGNGDGDSDGDGDGDGDGDSDGDDDDDDDGDGDGDGDGDDDDDGDGDGYDDGDGDGYDECDGSYSDNKSKEVLEGLLLHAPPNLQELEIYGYPAHHFPRQLFQGGGGIPLKSLKISHCQKLKCLPAEIGNLTELTSLEISYCDKLKCLPAEISDLTELTSLKIENCQQVVLGQELQKLASLTKLTISECQSIKCLPMIGVTVDKSSLHYLDVCACKNLTSLSEGLRYLRSLQVLKIECCPKLELGTDDDGDFQHLVLLHYLKLMGLPQLGALPDWIQHLPKLETLEIRTCENLTTLPEWLKRLTTLRSLTMHFRGRDLKQRCERDKGEDWHKISHIPDVYID